MVTTQQHYQDALTRAHALREELKPMCACGRAVTKYVTSGECNRCYQRRYTIARRDNGLDPSIETTVATCRECGWVYLAVGTAEQHHTDEARAELAQHRREHRRAVSA